jgi:hypothetical protein
MKTLISVIALLVFFGLLFIGCSEKTAQPVETSTVSLQKESSIEGAGITRYEAESYYTFWDGQLLLIIGCNDLSLACSGGGGYDLFKFKELLLPNVDPELRRLIMQINAGDATTIVWYMESWPEDNDLCPFVLNNEPIAIGTANFNYTDNDFYAWWQGHPNSNPYGYKANGSLVGSNGQEYNLNLVDRIIWDWDGSKFREHGKILLVPKGN